MDHSPYITNTTNVKNYKKNQLKLSLNNFKWQRRARKLQERRWQALHKISKGEAYGSRQI